MNIEKLSNLCNIVIGRTPARSEGRYWGKGNKWVSISDLNSKIICDTKEEITDYAVGKKRCRKIPKGTLLFSFKLTIGKMAFAGCDLYTNEAIAALIIRDNNILNNDFLYYALRVAEFLGSNQAAKGKTLNSKSLAQIKIPLPPIDDQIRIALMLEKVEELISRRKQHLQQIDDLLKSVFIEMFGDPIRNEKGWDRPELSQFGSISTGNTPPRKDASNYLTKHIEWIKTDNITTDSVYITHATEYLSEGGKEKGRTVTNGALLVACIAGSVESIGRAALTNRTVAFNQQINAIQPNSDINPFYLYTLFKISKAFIQSHATKGMKKILTKGDFEKIRMIKPPIDVQNDFAIIGEKVTGIKSRYQESLAELENLYGALSQKAFKDELDLSRIPLESKSVIKEQQKQQKATETEKMPQVVRQSIKLTWPAGFETLIGAVPDENAPDAEWERYRALYNSRTKDESSNIFSVVNMTRHFLNEYFGLLANHDRFIIDDFLEAALKKYDELSESSIPHEKDLKVYEEVRAWVYQTIEKGRLTQRYDDASNRVQLFKAKD